MLASRSAETLAVVADECADLGTGARPLVVPTDVADPAAVDALLAAARAEHGRVGAVVTTAAVVAYGRFDVVPAAAFDQVIRVNLLGTANVARSSLALFAQQDGGHLVIVGSLLGRIVTPWMSTYVTSKWAVHGLARTLQVEAREMPGVAVSLVSPGAVDTPIYSQAASYGGRTGRPPPPVATPEAVARRIVKVLARPRRIASVGLANWAAEAGFRYAPWAFDRLVRPGMSLGGLARAHVAPHPGNLWSPSPAGEAVHGSWGRHWQRAVVLAGVAGSVAWAVRSVGTTDRRR